VGSISKDLIKPFVGQPGGLLKALHALQNKNPSNFLSPKDIELAAEVFEVPVAKVWGTATFYSLYSTTPRGRHIIRVCESAPCHVVGALNILKTLEGILGVKQGETTTDGRFTLELTSCLGVCGVAPAVMINENVHGNLTPETISDILANYR
jgi:NADH:ubiquinone oxidoreductase subunit E